MLGIVYGLLIAAWIVLIIILKWRKSRIKREHEEQQIQQQQQMRPQIHVIQIGSSLYDVIQISPSQNNNNYCCDCPDYNQCATDNCHHNNAFILEDGAVFPQHSNRNSDTPPPTASLSYSPPPQIPSPIATPPPSYDEVMREIDQRNRARLMMAGIVIRNDSNELPKSSILSAARDRNTITTPPNFTNQN